MSDIADPTMSYEGLVEAGREARQQADNMQWVEGDLALQVEALSGNERPRDPETSLFLEDETKALKRYADDIDINYSSLQDYRRVAEAWPRSARADGVSWKTHRILSAQQDRFDLIQPGMTVRQARGIVRHRTAGTSGKPGWFELLGHVGDSLIAAEKHMTKAEDAISRKPNEALAAKATEYAGWAEALVARLRRLA